MSSYKKAINALAGGISGKNNNLSNSEKKELARELLHAEKPENHSQWGNIEISLGPNSTQVLAKYSRKLEENYNQEIGKDIHQVIQKVDKTTDLRKSLQQEVNQALNETKELEKIAKKLQDKGIGKIAGKEEKQINKLGEDLERINREGKELEKDKQKISQILSSHNLSQSDLHDELGQRASAVETVLQASGSGASSGGSNSDLDQIAQRIIQRESQLREAETKNLHKIKGDIRTLTRIVGIEKQEMEALNYVEEKMQQGDLKEAAKLIDNLIGKRQDFANNKDYSQVRQDLEDERKIIQAVGELFESIKTLENQNISRTRLYEELVSEGPFSSIQEAKNMLENIENEFKEMEEEVKKIKSLKEQERKLENLEHDKLKQIDDEDAQLRKKASSQDKQRLKSIHEKLQKLGFSLENKIDLSGGKSNNSSSKGSQSKGQSPKEWRELLENPGNHIDPDNGLNITSSELDSYGPPGKKSSNWCWYPEYYPQYSTPKQGFKFHISASPEEAYEVCKELIPVLQAFKIEHKIINSLSYIENKMNNKPLQKKKLMTIYPKTSIKADNQIFEVGNQSRNKKTFSANEPHTRKILEKIIKHADRNILNGGPKLKDTRNTLGTTFEAEEPRVDNTRIHITYSTVSGGNKIRTIIDENGNSTKNIRRYIAETDKNGKPKRKNSSNDPKMAVSSLSYLPNEKSFRKTKTNNSNYFLSHLLPKGKSDKVKQNLVTNNPEDAIFGYDAKVCGAHYLIPPEGYQKIKEITNDIV